MTEGDAGGTARNPFKSEAAMFRVLVVVLVAALPVIATALLAGPVAGLTVLGVELGVGVGLLWRALRAGRDEPVSRV